MTELEELQEHKKHLEEVLKFCNIVEKLKLNQDFKQFVKAYTVDEATRCLSLATNPSFNKEDLMNQAMATAHFKVYLDSFALRADEAKRALDQTETLINDLMTEEV